MDGALQSFKTGDIVNDRHGNTGEVIAAFVDADGNRRVKFADGLDTYEAPARLVSFYIQPYDDSRDILPTDGERAALDAETDAWDRAAAVNLDEFTPKERAAYDAEVAALDDRPLPWFKQPEPVAVLTAEAPKVRRIWP